MKITRVRNDMAARGLGLRVRNKLAARGLGQRATWWHLMRQRVDSGQKQKTTRATATHKATPSQRDYLWLLRELGVVPGGRISKKKDKRPPEFRIL